MGLCADDAAGGRLIDRFGPHNIAALATAIWSVAQMLTGAAINFATILLTRLGLGVGEAPFAPATYRSVGLWGPITERGTAIAAISAGSSLGAAFGAPFVAWVISITSWRWSFVVTGAIGLVWVVVFRSLVSTPEKTHWIPEPERRRILAERGGGLETPDHGGVGYLGLIRAPAMWGLFISQGCMVYTVYLYLSWLPNYLQTQRHMSVMGSGIIPRCPS
jgi:MFS family permease